MYIMDIAKSISKTIAGDGASITKAFSREAMSGLSYAAVKSDMTHVSKNLIADALNNKVITREAFEQASKADGFNVIDYANSIAKNGGGNEAYQKAIADFNKKSEAFAKVNSGALTEAEYFGRKAGEGIGWGRTAQGYFLDPTYGGTRTKATVGALIGGGVATRYLSGGNLTTTSTGERNIAGIPFI